MAFNFGGNQEVNLETIDLSSVDNLLEVNNVEQVFYLEEKDCEGELAKQYK